MKSILFKKDNRDNTLSIFKYGDKNTVDMYEKVQKLLFRKYPGTFKYESLIRFDFKNEDDFEKIKELGLSYSVTGIFREFEKGNITVNELYEKYK